MDSIEKIIDYYNNGKQNDSYHNVVEQLLKYIMEVPGKSIYDMADLCYSSVSTLSRLVKRMGFQNYADLKSQITYSIENYRYLNRNMREINLMEAEDIF